MYLLPFSRLAYFSCFCLSIIKTNQDTLIQHLEVAITCEEKATNGNFVILSVYPTMKVDKKKIKK
jgi:hypothetical protein